MTPQRECSYTATNESIQQLIDENDFNEKYSINVTVENSTTLFSETLLEDVSSSTECFIKPTNKVDIGVQCDPKVNIFHNITNRVFRRLFFLFSSTSTIRTWLKKFLERFKQSIIDWAFSKEKVCTCTEKLLDLEEKIKKMEEENVLSKVKALEDEERFRQLMAEIKVVQKQIESIRFMPINKPAVVVSTPVVVNGPCIPMPPPPPMPKSPLHKPMTIPKVVVKKTIENTVTSSRPHITAEALQSVKLKKVSDRPLSDLSLNQSGGPLVTMEQLRSVKLRPRRKPQTQAFSPTRTPICRDRIFKSRSPNVRKERRARLDRIPLSAILNMEEP